MIAAGLVLAVAGGLISIAGLGLMNSVGGRMAFALVGIAVSLFGILGILNKAYLANAIWRRDS